MKNKGEIILVIVMAVSGVISVFFAILGLWVLYVIAGLIYAITVGIALTLLHRMNNKGI